MGTHQRARSFIGGGGQGRSVGCSAQETGRGGVDQAAAGFQLPRLFRPNGQSDRLESIEGGSFLSQVGAGK